jgi:hypothetical protein
MNDQKADSVIVPAFLGFGVISFLGFATFFLAII